MGVNLAQTPDAIYAGLVTESIRRKFMPRFKNKLRFDPFAVPGKLELNGGAKVLRWNIMADIGAFITPLVEDVIIQDPGNKVSSLTVTTVLSTLADYGAWIPISDLATSVWTNETREEYSDVFAHAGAKTRDTLHRNAAGDSGNFLPAFTTVVRNRVGLTNALITTLSEGTTATAGDLNAIRGFFDQNDCDPFDEMGGNYVLIIHGKTEQDMVADVATTRLSWTPLIQNVPAGVDKITNYKGPGMLLGMAVLRSNNFATFALTISSTPAAKAVATTVTAYAQMALAMYGIGKTTMDQADPRVIIKRPGEQTVSIPLDTYGTIGFKLRLATRNLHVNRALTYYSPAGTGAA